MSNWDVGVICGHIVGITPIVPVVGHIIKCIAQSVPTSLQQRGLSLFLILLLASLIEVLGLNEFLQCDVVVRSFTVQWELIDEGWRVSFLQDSSLVNSAELIKRALPVHQIHVILNCCTFYNKGVRIKVFEVPES